MGLKKLCCHPCCHNFRLEGSRYCAKHKEKDEARDKERKEKYLKEYQVNHPNNSIYAPFYRTTRWHKESADYIRRVGCCKICGTTEKLQVHHNFPPYYQYNNNRDFFDKSHWVVLCVNCHAKVTKEKYKDKE